MLSRREVLQAREAFRTGYLLQVVIREQRKTMLQVLSQNKGLARAEVTSFFSKS